MTRTTLEKRIEQQRRTVKGVLTAQEHGVLLMTAEGFTDLEIASHLEVSTGTIQVILQRVRDRLEARNRMHCIHLAHQMGLLSTKTPAADRPKRIRRGPRTPPMGDAPGGGKLFERAGAIYRAKDPVSLPAVEPTHYLCVVHPTDSSKSWEIDISVPDDVQARRRMMQLAGWVYPPFRVGLRRPGLDGEQIDSVAAFCRPAADN